MSWKEIKNLLLSIDFQYVLLTNLFYFVNLGYIKRANIPIKYGQSIMLMMWVFLMKCGMDLKNIATSPNKRKIFQDKGTLRGDLKNESETFKKISLLAFVFLISSFIPLIQLIFQAQDGDQYGFLLILMISTILFLVQNTRLLRPYYEMIDSFLVTLIIPFIGLYMHKGPFSLSEFTFSSFFLFLFMFSYFIIKNIAMYYEYHRPIEFGLLSVLNVPAVMSIMVALVTGGFVVLLFFLRLFSGRTLTPEIIINFFLVILFIFSIRRIIFGEKKYFKVIYILIHLIVGLNLAFLFIFLS